jgi:serine/threonine protein kinase
LKLTNGARLGPYEIVSAIGAGGMGEVYRAHDSRLGRDVAIKILPEHFVADPERVARFQREAQVLAALNHPNIAIIHDIQHEDGMGALVLELVEGPTLADKIADGPIALAEALDTARQIADAVEIAHEQGIIHRDLKPANIKLRPDGTVKVLDFGLAKENAASNSTSSMSPTLSSPAATQAGIILGTAAYMSPEQARGKPADRRSDVWAFGCVLYEMLTGARAFEGDDVTDVLAAVIRGEPEWQKLPADTPPGIRKLLQRCLVKDRRERLTDMGSVRLEIKDAVAAPAAADAQEISASRKRRLASPAVAWTIAAISLIAAISVGALYLTRPVDARVTKTFILPPEGASWIGTPPATRFSLSPDGRHLAFIGTKGGQRQIWVRALDGLVPEPLSGTEAVIVATWSPDSRFLAFSAGGQLKKIDASGGPAIALTEMDNNSGLAWGPGNTILFRAPGQTGLHQVSAAGGAPVAVTHVSEKSGIGLHWQPFFLPDGKHFLYHATGGSGGVYVATLDPSEQPRLLIAGGSNAQYASGYVLFMRDTTLMAQRFDTDRLALEGEAHPLADSLQVGGDTGRTGAFAASQTGLLVYQTGAGRAGQRVVWFDRGGKVVDTINQDGDNTNPRLSPDGKQLVVQRRSATTGMDLWVIDLSRGTNTRLTSGAGSEVDGVWSPEGDRVLYRANPDGKFSLYSRGTAALEHEELVAALGQSIGGLNDWSGANQHMLFQMAGDLWVLPVMGEKKPQALMQTPFAESQGRFSPNGRWVAYVSQESNTSQVYVQPFPLSASARRIQISVNGGGNPRWRGDGKELFFTGPQRYLVSVDLKTVEDTLEAGPEKRLFQLPVGANSNFTLAPDGQRFLFSIAPDVAESSAEPPLTTVVNWTAIVKGR